MWRCDAFKYMFSRYTESIVQKTCLREEPYKFKNIKGERSIKKR